MESLNQTYQMEKEVVTGKDDRVVYKIRGTVVPNLGFSIVLTFTLCQDADLDGEGRMKDISVMIPSVEANAAGMSLLAKNPDVLIAMAESIHPDAINEVGSYLEEQFRKRITLVTSTNWNAFTNKI